MFDTVGTLCDTATETVILDENGPLIDMNNMRIAVSTHISR